MRGCQFLRVVAGFLSVVADFRLRVVAGFRHAEHDLRVVAGFRHAEHDLLRVVAVFRHAEHDLRVGAVFHHDEHGLRLSGWPETPSFGDG